MFDDLTKLAPNDLGRADPNWSARKGPILHEILARRRGSVNWFAAAAAGLALVVGAGGILTVLNQPPNAVPVTSADGGDPTNAPTTGRVGVKEFTMPLTLIDRDGETTACISTFHSLPPRCSQGFPVDGIDWEAISWAESKGGVTWADAILVGHFDGTQMNVQEVHASDDESAPRAAGPPVQHHEPLCPDPVRGTGTGNSDALHEAAQALPGYQGWWLSSNQTTYNIAVTRGVDRAIEALGGVFSGEFCVGTVPGPDAATVGQAMAKISDSEPAVTYGTVISREGLWLELAPIHESGIDKLAAMLSPEVLDSTRFTPVIRSLPVSSEAPDTPAIGPAPDGAWEPYELYTHCGIWELGHDGKWYLRIGGVLDDGDGNPPAGWANPIANGEILVVVDRIHYRDSSDHHEVFALREGATEPLRTCS